MVLVQDAVDLVHGGKGKGIEVVLVQEAAELVRGGNGKGIEETRLVRNEIQLILISIHV